MNDDLLEIAADWADRFDELSSAERDTLTQWLAASASHREAFDTMCSLMGSPALTTALLIQEADSRHASSASTGACASTSATSIPSDGDNSAGRRIVPLKPRTQRRTAPWYSVAAVAASVFVVMAAVWMHNPPEATVPVVSQATPWQYEVQTQTAQRDSIQFEDGSVVALNAQSSLSAQFSVSTRAVHLVQGQAYFDVAKDPQRPFVIDSGAATITVLGTAFDVNRLDDDVIVSVTEGRVQVAADRVLVLTAGQQVRIEAGIAKAIERSDGEAPDWLLGWHEAAEQPLHDVLQQVDRYLEKPLVLALGTASSQVVSGRYLLDDPESTLRMIATLYDLHIEYSDQAIIVSQ